MGGQVVGRRGGRGTRRKEEEEAAPTTADRTTWKLDGEKGSGYVISQSTIEINNIVWWGTFGGDSPSLLIKTQDRTSFTVCSGNHPTHGAFF